MLCLPQIVYLLLALAVLTSACRQSPPVQKAPIATISSLEAYVAARDTNASWETVATIPGDGYTTHVIRMESQDWLTEAEVKDPAWWHWLTVVVPDGVQSNTGLLFIGGGSRDSKQPAKPGALPLQTALASQTVVAELHNVPNQQLDLPKMIINATGDQFFLPDSWQFYWDSLPGEKHLRYVPNSEHSMRETDALTTLIAFYQLIVAGEPRPDFDWELKDGAILIETNPVFPPESLMLWQAHNPRARNFQVDSIGRAYEASPILLTEDGRYRIRIDEPTSGYSAFFVELTFPGAGEIPFKLSTGVVVTPDTYPHASFDSKGPKGNRE